VISLSDTTERVCKHSTNSGHNHMKVGRAVSINRWWFVWFFGTHKFFGKTFHAHQRSYLLFSCGTLSFKLNPFNGLLLLLWRVNSTSCKKKGLSCQPSTNELDFVIPTACQVRSVVVLPKQQEKKEKLIRGQKSKWSSFTFCKLRSVISHCAGGRSLCTDLPWSLHWVMPWQQGIAPWTNRV
jgi:hypothetical protein